MELNKIAGAVILAGLIAMLAGKTSELLYLGGGHHGDDHAKRGYQIEVTTASASGSAKEEVVINIASFLPTGDITKGAAFFKKRCASCHNAEQGAGAKIGPALYGVLNRNIGGEAGFKYSDALKDKGGVWDYDALSGFLTKPKGWAPGTIMAYAGIKKPEERADVIMYLRSLGKESVALPPVPVAEVPAEAPAE